MIQQHTPPLISPRRRRSPAPWIFLAIVLLLCLLFPPIRIYRYHAGDLTGAGVNNAFQPELVAQKFWEERLLPTAKQAPDAAVIIAALRADAASARKQYGQTPAIGGPTYFLIQGIGRVVSKEKSQISLTISTATGAGTDVVIAVGPLFGNAVRDGTGLLGSADFPNSNDFNALSTELNKLVKNRLFPTLRDHIEIGTHIHFAGIAELDPDEAALLPLRLVPVLVEVR